MKQRIAMLTRLLFYSVPLVVISTIIFFTLNKPDVIPSEIVLSEITEDNSNYLVSAMDTQPKAPSNNLPIDLNDSSLRGTDIDGVYQVDEHGNLLINDDLRHRFEYFLSLMGEFSQEHIFEMVREDIRSNLEYPSQTQALTLFDQYIDYKLALVSLESQLGEVAEYELSDIQYIRHQLTQLRNKRRAFFSPEVVEAFFGFDETYDDYMLSKIEILGNTQLSESEKKAHILALKQTLPHEIQAMQDETARITQAFAHTEQIKKSANNEKQAQQAVFEFNQRQFGDQAARRIQILEQQRSQWMARINRYQNKRSGILSDPTLSKEEQRAQILELQASSFNSNERRRLKAYD